MDYLCYWKLHSFCANLVQYFFLSKQVIFETVTSLAPSLLKPYTSHYISYSISGGTTWHAAGLVTALKGTESETKLATYAIDLIPNLEQLTGAATGEKITLTEILYYFQLNESVSKSHACN